MPSSAPVGGTARLSWADEEDVAAAEGTPGANDEDGDGEVVEPDSETDSELDAEHAHPVTTGGQDEDWGGDQVTPGRAVVTGVTDVVVRRSGLAGAIGLQQ